MLITTRALLDTHQIKSLLKSRIFKNNANWVNCENNGEKTADWREKLFENCILLPPLPMTLHNYKASSQTSLLRERCWPKEISAEIGATIYCCFRVLLSLMGCQGKPVRQWSVFPPSTPSTVLWGGLFPWGVFIPWTALKSPEKSSLQIGVWLIPCKPKTLLFFGLNLQGSSVWYSIH